MKPKSIMYAGIVAAVLMSAFVWPTIYRYEKVNRGLGTIRINRVTSSVSFLTLEGWSDLKPAERTPVAVAVPVIAPAAYVPPPPHPQESKEPASAPVEAATEKRPMTDDEALKEIDRIMSRKAPGN